LSPDDTGQRTKPPEALGKPSVQDPPPVWRNEGVEVAFLSARMRSLVLGFPVSSWIVVRVCEAGSIGAKTNRRQRGLARRVDEETVVRCRELLHAFHVARAVRTLPRDRSDSVISTEQLFRNETGVRLLDVASVYHHHSVTTDQGDNR